MLERYAEINKLEAVFAEVVRGLGQVVVMHGPAGSGKTTVVRGFAGLVGSRGAVWLRASGFRAERDLSLGVVLRLFASEVFGDTLPVEVRRLLNSGIPLDVVADTSARWALLHELCAALLKRAECAPVVVAIDDIQYLDALSREFLLYLIRRATSSHLLILLSGQETAATDHREFCVQLDQLPHCHRIRLSLLSRDKIAELATRRLGEKAGDALVEMVHAATGGNPLLAEALLDDQRNSSARQPDRITAGESFVQGLLIVLHNGDVTSFRVATALAVLGDVERITVLGDLAGVTAGEAAVATATLASAGLLESGRFRHPAARSTVLDTMAAKDRDDMQWRAAQLLAADGADAVTVAEHIVAAGRSPDAWATDILVQAADHALDGGRSAAAIGFFRAAYRANSKTWDSRRAGILLGLVRAETRIDPAKAVLYLTDLASVLRAGLLRGRDAATAVTLLCWYGRFDEAVDIIGRTRDPAAGVDARTRREVDSVRRWMSLMCPGRFRGTPDVAGGQPDEETISWAERTLRQYPVAEHTLAPLLASLLALLRAEHLDEAQRLCLRVSELAGAGGTPTWYGLFAAVAAEIELRTGRFAEAETYARSALAHLPLDGWGVAAGFPLGTIVLAQLRQGKTEEASWYLGQRPPDAMFGSMSDAHYLNARGRYHLETDLLDMAVEDFRACEDLEAQWGVDFPGLVPWRTGIAEVCLRTGDVTQARKYLREQLDLLGDRGAPGRTRGRTLRLLAATEAVRQRPVLLRKAMAVLEESGDRFELAAALTDLHRAYRAIGQRGRARSAARKANILAKWCRAGATMAEPELLPDRPGGLSDAEHRVALLAAEGHTNREIASRLFVTMSTVEQHLTRIYRKLRVHGRSELADWFQVDSAVSS